MIDVDSIDGNRANKKDLLNCVDKVMNSKNYIMNDLEFVEYYREWIEINFLFKMDIWIKNRESMKIEIQQRVGLNPFCICHPIISFHNREEHWYSCKHNQHCDDMCNRTLSEEEERYKGWDEIWITKDRIMVHNQQIRIDSLFYS